MRGKWTSGPWHVQPAFRSIYALINGLTTFVCKAEGHQCGEDQADANAYLIAASPTMATELEWIAAFAEMRAEDDSKTFARVNRAALRTIAQRARAALSQALPPKGDEL